MNTRIRLSVFLIIVGIFLAFIPKNQKPSFKIRPGELVQWAGSDNPFFTPDQVAALINREDTTILLIDVRDKTAFDHCRLPGAVHIPLNRITEKNYEAWLSQKKMHRIFYSDGDAFSVAAMTIATGMGYQNNFYLAGGLNAWYDDIMITTFSGDRISPQENALFGNRYEAKRLFTEFNSLPDSLKEKYYAVRQLTREKLDGGCE